MIRQETLKYKLDGKEYSEFSTGYLEGVGQMRLNSFQSNSELKGTDLMRDSEGNIWTLRFLLGQGGVELIRMVLEGEGESI